MKKISVAIDGPAGAGKSSVAKTAASVLGYVYIDTGAMYRSVAVYAIENGIDIAGERQRLIKCLGDIDISLRNDGGRQTVYLNDVDVTERIRTADASMGASAVAVIPEVREKLVSEQKAMARDGGVIMDGRDIGTSVLPGAELKIYLTASVAERAKRRYNENIKSPLRKPSDGHADMSIWPFARGNKIRRDCHAVQKFGKDRSEGK